MNGIDSAALAVQIIPDLSIDKKYATIIVDALARINSFAAKAVENGRVDELFLLQRSGFSPERATKILSAGGRFIVGFQFETNPDDSDDNFQVFVKKMTDGGNTFKFHLSPSVQTIMLQLISLEDRRTVAIFSMLNTSMDIGYRILTTLYANQLKRIINRIPRFMEQDVKAKFKKLKTAKSQDEAEDLWKEVGAHPLPAPTQTEEARGGSQDNLLQVMADDTMFDELNLYVGNVISRTQRLKEKWRRLQENPDMPRTELYQEMVKEDLDRLENCYARMHIYLKAFYKRNEKRSLTQNKILRQFFGAQIEEITAEVGLLEDLLCLNQDEYFKNLDRHKTLEQ